MRLPSGETCTSSAYSSWKTSTECRRRDSGSGAAPTIETKLSRTAPSAARDLGFIVEPRARFSTYSNRRWPQTGAPTGARQLLSLAPSLIAELGAQGNLRIQHLGDRAAGLGLLGDFLEGLVVDVGHLRDTHQVTV